MDPKGKLKRKRSVNWSVEDMMLLKDLINSRVKDIENKNADTNNTKKKAWLEVVESFNSMCSGGQRTLDQLKMQWATTKITARKQVAEHRKGILKTGGVLKPQEAPLSASDITVWLPNEFLVDTNEFDSDYVKEFFEKTEKETQNEDETLTDEAVDVVEMPKNNSVIK